MNVEILEAAAELFALNAEIKKMEERAKVLKEMMKDVGSFEDGGYAVAIKSSDRTTVDPKMLREKYPEIAAEVSKTSSVTSVTIKKV
jgi:predicted phage-related endonuclease